MRSDCHELHADNANDNDNAMMNLVGVPVYVGPEAGVAQHHEHDLAEVSLRARLALARLLDTTCKP